VERREFEARLQVYGNLACKRASVLIYAGEARGEKLWSRGRAPTQGYRAEAATNGSVDWIGLAQPGPRQVKGPRAKLETARQTRRIG
jgi:hypothetical protein